VVSLTAENSGPAPMLPAGHAAGKNEIRRLFSALFTPKATTVTPPNQPQNDEESRTNSRRNKIKTASNITVQLTGKRTLAFASFTALPML
jgi:hypothetical protein